MRARSFLVVVSLATAACSLLVDTDDLAREHVTLEEQPDADVVLPAVDGARAEPDAAAPFVCPAGAFVCEDFESGLGKWEEHPDANGRIELVTTASHSPSHAFASGTVGGTELFQAELRSSLPAVVKTGSLVFRAWMRFEGGYFDQTGLVKLRAVEGLEDMNLKILEDGRLKIDADVKGAGDELAASKPVPLDRWVCVEWHAELGTPGRSRLMLDGETVIDAVETNVPESGYRVFGFGFPGTAGPHQRVLWDDVVIAPAPVGCR